METFCTGSTPGKFAATSAWPISRYATLLRSSLLGILLFFSIPATIRSIATVKSSKETSLALRLVAAIAAETTADDRDRGLGGDDQAPARDRHARQQGLDVLHIFGTTVDGEVGDAPTQRADELEQQRRLT